MAFLLRVALGNIALVVAATGAAFAGPPWRRVTVSGAALAPARPRNLQENSLSRKAQLDTDGDGYISEAECKCEEEGDGFEREMPSITKDMIDFSTLGHLESIAQTIAAVMHTHNGMLEPATLRQMLENSLAQNPDEVLGAWTLFWPDGYYVAFGEGPVNLTGSGIIGAGPDADQPMRNLSEYFIDQLGRTATLTCPYVYSNPCCPPVIPGDYVTNIDGAVTLNYMLPDDPDYDFAMRPVRDYFQETYGRKSFLQAGQWSVPYADPVTGVMVSFAVPMVTSIPVVSSFDPWVFLETGAAAPGPRASWEGKYVFGVAGVDVKLSNVILACEAGKYSQFPDCVSCPRGKYRNDEQSAAACYDCEPGTYGNITGLSACAPCDQGSYMGIAGQTYCEACPAGRVAPAAGMVDCTACPQGQHRGSLGGTQCDRCAAGLFQNSTASTACTPCPGTKTTQGLGAVFEIECVCDSDSYAPLASDACVSCGEGLECDVGSTESALASMVSGNLGGTGPYPRIAPGYMSLIGKPLEAYLCLNKESCPGGLPEQCASQLEGIACGRCAEGYYAAGNDGCKKCNGMEASGFLYPWLVVIISPFACVVFYRTSWKRVDEWSAPTSLVRSLVFLAIGHYSGVALVKRTNGQFCNTASEGLGIWDWLLDVSSIFRPACAGFSSFDADFISKITFPAFLLVLFLCTWAGSVVASKPWKALRMERDILVTCYGGLYLTFFTPIASIALNLWVCYKHPNGTFSLRSRPEVLCYDEQWKSKVVVSVIAVLVYCVAALALFLVAVLRAPSHFGSEYYQKRWQFLLMKFHPEVYWWAPTILIKGLLLTLAGVIFQAGSLQVYWMSLVYFVYMMLVVAFKPWRHPSGNIMDLGQTGGLILVCGFAAYYSTGAQVCSSSNADVAETTGAVTGLMLATSFTPLVVLLGAIVALVYFHRQAADDGTLAATTSDVQATMRGFANTPEALAKGFMKQLLAEDRRILLAAHRLVCAELMGKQTGKKRLIYETELQLDFQKLPSYGSRDNDEVSVVV